MLQGSLKRGFWSQLFTSSATPKFKYTFEELQTLYSVLLRNPIVTDINKAVVVETIRSIAEFIIWGDQNEPKMLDFFLENNVMLYLYKLLTQPANRMGDIAKQVLQTLSIIVQNVKSETGIFFLFSNNHINSIVELKFDFEDEEVLGYYISFLKTISLKLNNRTVQFFVDLRNGNVVFPLYTEAIKFAHHKEGMVRAAVRTLTLNVMTVDDSNIHAFISSSPAVLYFFEVANYACEQFKILDRRMGAAESGNSQTWSSLDSQIAEVEDILTYCSDILSTGPPCLAHIFAQILWKRVVGSYILRPLLASLSSTNEFTKSSNSSPSNLPVPSSGAPGASPPIRPSCALYVLERLIHIIHYSPLLHNLLLVLLTDSHTHVLTSHDQGNAFLTPSSKKKGDSEHPLEPNPPSPKTPESRRLSCREALLKSLKTGHLHLVHGSVRVIAAILLNKHITPPVLAAGHMLPVSRASSLADSCSACDSALQAAVEAAQAVHSGPSGEESASAERVASNSEAAGVSFESLVQPVVLTACGRSYTYNFTWTPAEAFTLPVTHLVGKKKNPASSAPALPAPLVQQQQPVSQQQKPPTQRQQPPIQQQQVQSPLLQPPLLPQQQVDSHVSLPIAEILDGPLSIDEVQLLDLPSTTSHTASQPEALSVEEEIDNIVSELTKAVFDSLEAEICPVVAEKKQEDSMLVHIPVAETSAPVEPPVPVKHCTHYSPYMLLETPEQIALAEMLAEVLNLELLPLQCVWLVGCLLHELLPPKPTQTGTEHAQSSVQPGIPHVTTSNICASLSRASTAARSTLIDELGGMWAEAVFPLIHLEWGYSRSALMRPVLPAGWETLLCGPHTYPTNPRRRPGAQQASSMPPTRRDVELSTSAVSALHLYHAVQRVVAIVQISELLFRGQITAIAPDPVPEGDLESRTHDISEGQTVDVVEAIPCVVSFRPGAEQRVYFGLSGPALARTLPGASSSPSTESLKVFLHSSPVVILADPAPTRLHAGLVLSAAPLLGATPATDSSVARWLHLHVRPSLRGLLRVVKTAHNKRGGVVAAMVALTDGHWVLAFQDVERASNARGIIERHVLKLRALYVEALDDILANAWPQIVPVPS